MNDTSTRLHKDQRKEIIKHTALLKMVEEGVENVSMRSIAEESGISDTLLYRYFPNKYAILYEILDSHFEDIESRVEDIFNVISIMSTDLASAIPTLVKILKKLLDEYKLIVMLFVNEEENLDTYIKEGKEILEEKNEDVREINIEYFLNPQTTAVIADYFKKCQKEGSFREELDPHKSSMMLITIIWQNIIKKPYKFLLGENMDDAFYQELLDYQINILIESFHQNKN